MSLKGIKLVTFDATNTILKFRVPPWQYYAAVASKHGFRGTESYLKLKFLDNYNLLWEQHPNFGRDSIKWRDWWRRVVIATLNGQMPANTNLQDIADLLIKDFQTTKCWECSPGAVTLIKSIRNKGISIGVISNFDPRLYDILKNVNLIKNFEFIVTSYDTGVAKPDAKIFQHALEKCSKRLASSECLHIGDNVKKDYEGAHSAGWHALLISSAEIPLPNNHVYKSLKDLSIAINEDKLIL